MMAATARTATPFRNDRPIDMVGHVFGRFTALALLVLLGIAAWYRQPAVVTLLGLTLATVGVSRGWSKLSLRRVHCERSLSTSSLFPGEELLITTRLSNQKLLPLPWIDVAQQTPAGLLGPGQSGVPGAQTLAHSFSMPWYSRLTWRQPIRPERRGYYVIPPLTVTSGDILGLYPRTMDAGSYEHISVYPRLHPVRRLPLQRADATGDLTGRFSLQEDPTRMRGIRDYQPQDGMRRVHWKASARHQNLMVKLYEPSALSRVNLVLAADTFDGFTDDGPFELAISSIASIACFCVERQMQVGFLGNSNLVTGRGQARLAPGSGNVQLVALLEILARVTPGIDAPFKQLCGELRTLALSGAGLIVVVGHMNESHINAFTLLSSRNHPLLVLQVGTRTSHATVPFRHRIVHGPDDLLDLEGA
jgi:uncharacterized protein (DUF58 family)